ncbi:Asp23/Gls24 family envelope stress response protein [Arthrobacter sp. YN]|uniref:Asp23/Gls24 family envelope stress response protein n=1 Tax=Arthrobacter sp. YN TaxID=2020486 RepID=UPI000B60905D|nr:Asp23/Gls24 family envelope stress response protein [Arthrobacter sp. YN]ASN22635.1 Asp23/Gls24 family envelope stress response protein [Arthrobacter sp. YN]
MTIQTHTPAEVPAKNSTAATTNTTATLDADGPALSAPALNKGKDGRGATTVADGVVAKIAGIAIQEIPGVHALGGGAARAIGNLREKVGQKDLTQGVSVEVGQTQVAVDVTLVVEYPHPLQEVADNARDAVYNAIEDLVGMEVTEVNITITDIHVPSEDADIDDAGREPRVA